MFAAVYCGDGFGEVELELGDGDGLIGLEPPIGLEVAPAPLPKMLVPAAPLPMAWPG